MMRFSSVRSVVVVLVWQSIASVMADSEAEEAGEQITKLRAAFKAAISAEPTIIPKLVRLGFHDGVGGSNGCVDLGNPDNAGLEPPIAFIEGVVAAEEDRRRLDGEDEDEEGPFAPLTRADIWSLASMMAVEVAQDVVKEVPFAEYGRVDCDSEDGRTDANQTSSFPPAWLAQPDLMAFFNETFGLSIEETVVAMGGHSLGGMSCENSGFNGIWDPTPLVLDNNYYIAQISGWQQDPCFEEANDCSLWSLGFTAPSVDGNPEPVQLPKRAPSCPVAGEVVDTDLAPSCTDPLSLSDFIPAPRPPCIAVRSLGYEGAFQAMGCQYYDDNTPAPIPKIPGFNPCLPSGIIPELDALTVGVPGGMPPVFPTCPFAPKGPLPTPPRCEKPYKFLTADIALLRDVSACQTDPDNPCAVGCTLGLEPPFVRTDPLPDGTCVIAIVAKFANDNALFVNSFVDVFNKMTSNLPENGQPLKTAIFDQD